MEPIYVDIDDVLADSTKAFLNIIDREFGKKVSFEDIYTFDLKESFDLTDSEFSHFFDVAHSRDELLDVEPIEGAVNTLCNWADKGYDIAVITGRLTSSYEATLEWLSMHKVPFNSFTIVDKYQREGMDKRLSVSLEVLSEMSFCLAIEDSLTMACYLSDHMDIPVALMDRPWNRNGDLNGGIKRYHGWPSLEDAHPEP